MFHPYRKDSSYLRTAMFKVYKEKCVYCGRTIQQRDMFGDIAKDRKTGHFIAFYYKGIR